MKMVLGFACAFLLSVVSMPLIIKVAHRRKLYDSIDERKIHTGNIPRLGGIGLFVSFLVSILIVTLLSGEGIDTGGRFSIVLLCMLGVYGIGLIDDFKNLRARYKFLVELAVAVLLVSLGFRFQTIIVPFGDGALELGLFSYPIAVIWIIGITNALNLIDGMDGFAGGISAISAGVFGLFFLLKADPGAALACFVLLGAVLGFLVFNLPPAKIFMGDSGALFLGFTMAVLPLIGPASGLIEISLISAVTILIIPIYDTFSAMIRRTRAHVSVFTPDKLHLHHKLLSLGLSVRGALCVIYAAQIFLCLVALSGFVFSVALSFTLKIASWVLFAFLFYAVGAVAKRRVASDSERELAEDGLVELDSLTRKASSQSAALKTSLVGGAFETRQSTVK
jgi:UDP-GlcNAc:undecaprenyl-phosphate/decaprenyl-phosphate GlcNAc-1-phosphate transferase